MSTLIVRLAVGLATASVLVGCGSNDPTTPPAATSPAAPPSQVVGDAPAGEEPSAGPSDPSVDLADDEHPVLIQSIDAGALTVTFDLVQWLTGDAAKVAFQQANPGETDGPPNDYYVVNNNPRLRTYRVAPDVIVRVTPGGDPNETDELTLAEFGGYAQRDALFWLTIQGGTITRIEQQWVP